MELNTYAILISETLARTVLVTSSSSEAALRKINSVYDEGEIVLDYNDFVRKSIELSPDWQNGIFTGDSETRFLFDKVKS